MKKHHHLLNIRNTCKFLGVSPSDFYASLHRNPSKHSIEDAVLKDQVKDISENILNQNFDIKQKNKLWYGDINGFTRSCVAYSIKDHMKYSLVIESLHEAVQKQKPSKGLIIHTDKESQYTGSRFYEYMTFSGFVHSQSRTGNPCDNAVMESFFEIFKREVFNQYHFKRKAEAISETVDYLENYYIYEWSYLIITSSYFLYLLLFLKS